MWTREELKGAVSETLASLRSEAEPVAAGERTGLGWGGPLGPSHDDCAITKAALATGRTREDLMRELEERLDSQWNRRPRPVDDEGAGGEGAPGPGGPGGGQGDVDPLVRAFLSVKERCAFFTHSLCPSSLVVSCAAPHTHAHAAQSPRFNHLDTRARANTHTHIHTPCHHFSVSPLPSLCECRSTRKLPPRRSYRCTPCPSFFDHLLAIRSKLPFLTHTHTNTRLNDADV